MNHYGHYGHVVDFDWNEYDKWSFISTSDDVKSSEETDGCLQIY